MKAAKKAKRTVRKHPAESGGLAAAAVVTLGLGVFNLNPGPQIVSALVILVAALPAAITWSIERARGD